MIQLNYQPWNRDCTGEEGESLLEIAVEQEIPLDHACGGDAVCSTCAVRILEGAELLTDMEDLERETLDKLVPKRSPETRLACQTLLTGGEGRVRLVSLDAAERSTTA